MKKQNLNDCARWTLAILGAFGLALFSLGAAACEGVSNPPTNKPPDEGKDIVVPDVKSLKGSRSGDSSDIITIDWTDPASKDFDFIELSFTPAHPSVPEQPIQVEKGTETYELDQLTIAQDYKFTLKAVKGTAKSGGKSVTVKGASVDIGTAIARAIASGSGAGTMDDPFKFTLKNADLSNQTTLNKLLTAIEDSEMAFFDMDLSDNGAALLWPRITAQAVTKIVGIVLPDGVLEITDDTSIDGKSNSIFSAYTNLRTVSAANVELIGKSAFRVCYNLREAKFPKALTLNDWAFDQCNSLETIDAPMVKKMGKQVFWDALKLQGANFPALETITDENPFNCCVLLNEENVNFDSLTNLPKYMFRYLETTRDPDQTVYKGPVFTSTKRADGTLVFPAAQTIGENAFANQYMMADAYFPRAKTTGKNPFANCVALTDANAMNFDSLETISESTFEYSKGGMVNGVQLYNPKLTTTLRDNLDPATRDATPKVPLFPKVKTIGNKAFRWQYELADAYFPEAESVGSNAFTYCTELNNADVLNFDKVTSIGEYAFCRDNATTAPDGTTGRIGPVFELTRDEAAFPDRVLVFPALQTVAKQALSSASGIATPAVIDLPAAISIGEAAFNNRTGVTKVNLPAVTSIHTNTGTLPSAIVTSFNFASLPALPSATFFKGRATLKVANISSLTALAADAFVNCPALDELYVGATPPAAVTAAAVFGTGTADGNTFYSGNSFTIFVPAGNDEAGTAWQDWIDATLDALASNVTVTVPDAPQEPAAE